MNLKIIFLGAAAFLAMTTGCYKMASVSHSGQSGSVNPGAGAYAFISLNSIKSILSNTLALPGTDPKIMDAASPSNGMSYTTLYAPQLGTGDAKPSALKAKLAITIFIEGCTEALSNPATVARLFPNGPADVVPLFRTLLLRDPTAAEIAILNQLRNSFSSATAPAAQCATILGSIEGLGQS